MMLRYEDFVKQPKETLLRIRELVGDDWSDINFFSGDNKVRLNANHTVSGNPNRFQKGDVQILPDDEWQGKMAKGQKLAVTALTWPLLLNYGYLRSSSAKTSPPLSDEIRFQ